MTTIAFKDGILATDGRVVIDGSILTDDFIKILVPFPTAGRAVAIMGDVAEALAAAEEIVERPWGAWKGDVGDNRIVDVKLDEGEAIIYECRGYYTIQGTFAFGSGSSAATGAMLAGMDAPEAVEIACLVDCKSGGTIRFVGAPGTKGIVCLDEYREAPTDRP